MAHKGTSFHSVCSGGAGRDHNVSCVYIYIYTYSTLLFSTFPTLSNHHFTPYSSLLTAKAGPVRLPNPFSLSFASSSVRLATTRGFLRV